MKIAHICPNINYPGGTERFVKELNLAFKELGVSSEVYSSTFSWRPALLSNVAMSALLARKALRKKSDALIFHKGQAASAFFKKEGTISYFHQVKYDEFLQQGIVSQAYQGFLRAIERDATQVVCNSKYTASRIEKFIPKADPKVVYPGARTWRGYTNVSGEDSFCFYHSRFHPRKNQEFLLRVFQKSSERLRLTGGTWDYKFRNYVNRVILLASEMSNITLETDVPERTYLDLLSRSSLFLFPAVMEPFGFVLLDAMALGRPVVAMNSGASPEVVGDAGILCIANLEHWRTTITKVLSTKKLRLEMSNKGLAQAGKFSWEKTAKELLGILST